MKRVLPGVARSAMPGRTFCAEPRLSPDALTLWGLVPGRCASRARPSSRRGLVEGLVRSPKHSGMSLIVYQEASPVVYRDEQTDRPWC